jgi:uracil-DNA glycosylase family 4
MTHTPNFKAPDHHCTLCPRLYQFLDDQRTKEPTWHNGPVKPFGPQSAQLLIVGLAPGLQGANKTGRPFTGDYAGVLLYNTLHQFGFANNKFDAHINDGLELYNCRISNAVKCVPPQNKPTGAEIKTCSPFLASEIKHMPNLQIIVTLGRIAHNSLCAILKLKQSQTPFSHGGVHHTGPYTIINSYHCSRYNTNTGRLTAEAFATIFQKAQNLINS